MNTDIASPTIIDNAGLWDARLLQFETLPSSNTWALANMATLAHGDVILVLDQTAGRGRFDRKWISAPNQCLTLSIIFEPTGNEFLATEITRILAIAAARTLEHYHIRTELKWPNDVMASGGKIAGILAEQDSASGKIVAGIGINMNLARAQLAEETFITPATSMFIETSEQFVIGKVYITLARQLENLIATVELEGSKVLQRMWNNADYLKNRLITITTASGETSGRYAGVAADGRLILIDDKTSQTQLFWSGDVSMKRL